MPQRPAAQPKLTLSVLPRAWGTGDQATPNPLSRFAARGSHAASLTTGATTAFPFYRPVPLSLTLPAGLRFAACLLLRPATSSDRNPAQGSRHSKPWPRTGSPAGRFQRDSFRAAAARAAAPPDRPSRTRLLIEGLPVVAAPGPTPPNWRRRGPKVEGAASCAGCPADHTQDWSRKAFINGGAIRGSI